MIEIKRNKACDSRTASPDTTFDEFKEATLNHINEVSKVMDFLANNLHEAGLKHDHTKIETIEEQYATFKKALNKEIKFNESSWYKMHTESERHHLLVSEPDDVNLLDILEMLSDISVASLGRSNKRIENINLNKDLLDKAVNNTLKLINDNLK